MASTRIYIPTPTGDLISLNSARGMRILPDGRVLLPGEDNSPVAVFDPDEYEGVDRDEVVKTFRRLLIDHGNGKPVVLPDWMKSLLA
ncbi:hypothetical protein [Aureimonas sp. AU12]|uniref:hypothetical protein n=1 Tax=Aureimonas sp. AU12 TaxID=1638161 RepID=UPI00070691C1|nr:hypothetical protein [Aureimonas sp. AU12]BAT29748.1 U3 small nucleolar RNA-associated protein 15 [Aureimonas sp. AU12]